MDWVRETEAAAQRVYSSSSARCFDRIFDHELCTNGYFESVLNKRALNLSDLEIPFDDNDYLLEIRYTASQKDKYVGEYVKRLIPLNLTGVKVSVDKELDQFRHLQPFLKSVENRLDVVFLKSGLPLLIVEVQSSPFHQSVSKTR